MWGTRPYLRWQPIRPGKYNHTGFQTEEEVTEHLVSFYPWGSRTRWVEDIMCQYSWKWGRSPHQATSLRWKAKRFCQIPFTLYLSDNHSGGICHMGCGLIPWWFIPHTKATVYLGQSQPLSVSDLYVDMILNFYFLYTKDCHADVIPFFVLYFWLRWT